MESLQSEDGQFFIRSLAQFIRQHEKALANSLQLTVHRRQASQNVSTALSSPTSPVSTIAASQQSHSTLASALSLTGLNFMSHNIKSAHLTLTPHHLFYLLSRIEELGIGIGPMNVRIESLHNETSQSNYISFLQTPRAPNRGRSDGDSIHSVSSVRSVMSGMSAFWSSIGLGSGTSKSDKAKAAVEADLKYLYSSFTKLPSLRLTSDPRARLIKGYEEFPFDTAVPLFAFKNVQQLDIVDMDFRHFHGWDRLAEQLCLLTVKRGNVEDLEDLLTNVVLDDAEKRRRRLTRNAAEPPSTPSWTVPSTPTTPHAMYTHSRSEAGSPEELTPGGSPLLREQLQKEPGKTAPVVVVGSVSPKRPNPNRPNSSYRHARSYSSKIKRSGSGSSNSSDYCSTPQRSNSNPNLFDANVLPSSKWQRLKYLSLADNALTSISERAIAPLTTSLRSLNLASNLFNEIPDSLATLSRLTSLDLSNCMIESLQSLSRSPLPAITTMKLKSNRLRSLAGIERLMSLENLNLQGNMLSDPMEIRRLTGMPNLRRLWIKYNPLTKQFPGYRVTIMNLFRQTPGYTEDIIIDDQPATYAERKLLVARVPEIERQLTIADPRCHGAPIIIQQSRPVDDTSQGVQSGSHGVTRAELDSTSTRRKKVPRRRIVDLAAKDEAAREEVPRGKTPLTLDTAFHPVVHTKEEEAAQTETRPCLSDTSDLELEPTETTEPALAYDDRQHDEYRVRVEALRQQFGTNWLSALGSQNMHTDHHYANEAEQQQQRSTIHHAASPVIVTGGRSIG